MHTRVGLVVGGVGTVLLFIAQLKTGLAALPLVVLVGLVAGLSVAKWLPRAWFGRQFEAGVRAGTLACGMAIVGLLVSLMLYGQHAVAPLANTSRLLGLDLGPAVRLLGFAGWAGAALLLAVVAFAIGTPLAAVAALLGGWDKNREAILAVERARDAAQRSARYAGVGHPSAARVTTSTLSTPASIPAPAPSVAALSSPALGGREDLVGLMESFYALRSPVSMVPPPGPGGPAMAPQLDSAAFSLASPSWMTGQGAVVPTAEPERIDAASLVEDDPGATSAELPIPQPAEIWSTFASWREPELEPEPEPVGPRAPTDQSFAPVEPLMERLDEPDAFDQSDQFDQFAGDEEDAPPAAPSPRVDGDSWLC
jgi:hypothetical protein